ncbi:TPA_exp: Uncharacterized protein A8136_6304 [Trichophyton benhamiae CBS 112371]|nr:TPA_exp: Uncharacterized protein A8136_6304 [Trichophyton benhamiae CBS 112371]
MAKNHEELDQYGSMSLDPPASPQYYEGGRGSEGIEERDSIMEESDSDTIGRSALEDEGENESGVVDGWSEDAKNALAVQYRRHKKKFCIEVGNS